MIVAAVIAVVVVAALLIVGAIATKSRAMSLPPPLQQILDAPPWHKLDNECWTQERKPRPTIFFIPAATGQHNLWLHYYDDIGNISGLTVEACVAPTAPSEDRELPGLPDGLGGALSFEVQEGEHWISSDPREEHIAQARELLVDAGELATLPGAKLTINSSHSGGFRINVYFAGGVAELAIAMRVAESVEKRIVPNVG